MNVLYLILFAAFVAPLPILFIEWIIPIPSIIEELFTVLIVLLIYKQEKVLKKSLLKYLVLAGILFSVSEAILYLNNIFLNGNTNLFLIRLVFTTIIHTSNFIFIYLLGKKGVYWLILAFIIAVLIHYIYNKWIVYMIVNTLLL